MTNWCIMNPLESDTLALDSPDMIALQACILQERRGVPLAPASTEPAGNRLTDSPQRRGGLRLA
jgi:hypothetical protein